MESQKAVSSMTSSRRRGARLIGGLIPVCVLLALALSAQPASARLVRAQEPFSPINGTGTGAAFAGEPEDVAVDSSTGNVFVIAPDADEIRIFNGEGGPPTGVASPYRITGLSQVHTVEVDNSATSPTKGALYVAPRVALGTTIQRFVLNPATETYEVSGTLAGSPPLPRITDIAVDSKGNVFVANEEGGASGRTVVEFSPDGTELARIPMLIPKDEPASVIRDFRAMDIAVNTKGDLFARELDHCSNCDIPTNFIYKFPANALGEIEADASSEKALSGGLGPYFGPIAIDQGANQLFVTNNEDHQVRQYDASTLTQQLRFGEGELSRAGRLAANPTSHRVYVIQENGVIVYSPEVPVPDATTGEVATNGTKAVLSGTVNPLGETVTECKFEYGPTVSYGSSAPCEGATPPDSSPHEVTAAIGGLVPQGATYHFRIVAKNNNGTNSSPDDTFRSGEIYAATNASSVTATTATLNGIVKPEGSPIGECKFEFGETESYGSSMPCTPSAGSIPADSSDHAVSAVITALAPNHRYHFRLVASGGLGGFSSEDRSFVTVGPPLIAEEDSVDVQATSATLRAQVNSRGSATSYYFEYGTDASYSSRFPADSDLSAGSGTSPEEVSVELPGLGKATNYHFRVVATNSFGVAKGPDQVFVTLGAECPNEEILQAQTSDSLPSGISFLPSCMGLEMVTPPRKFNQGAYQPGISLDGNRIKFQSDGGFAGATKLGTLLEHYVASRTANGWVSSPATTPPQFIKGSGVVGKPCSYSSDLSRWNLWASTLLQSNLGITTAFEGGLDGAFSPLSPTLFPINDNFTPNTVKEAGDCLGSSSNASHEFFSFGGGFGYIKGQPIQKEPPESTPYEAYRDDDGVPTIRLVARDKFGTVFGGSCGALIGGRPSGFAKVIRGAISSGNDASRIFLSARHDEPEAGPCDATHGLRLFKRTLTSDEPEIVEISQSECTRVAPPCDTSDGNDLYRGASQEGDKVFFETTRQLVNTDLDTSKDVYLFDGTRPEGSKLTQVSAGDESDPIQGEDAGVLGVVELAGNGSRVYFVATGLLTTTPNQTGEQAVRGQRNLYMYERDEEHPGGRTLFIGRLTAQDFSVWVNGPGANSAAAVPLLSEDLDEATGGDGHILAFLTAASLLPADTDGGAQDVYRFDSSSGLLQLISKAGLGGTDGGPFDASRVAVDTNRVLPNVLSFDRWISNDGGAVVFTTKEPLSANDDDGKESVYIWQKGSLTAIPVPGDSATVSLSGNEIAFSTESRLLPEDGDGTSDVYVARAGGGFPIPPPPAPCVEEACQGAASLRPPGQGATSDSFNGPGNAKGKAHKKKKRKHGKRHSKQKRQGHKQGGRK